MVKIQSIVVTKEYILLSIKVDDLHIASWEELQALKEEVFPGIWFVELFPAQKVVINNANVRHLYHLKGVELPCLNELEDEKDCTVLIPE